MTRNRNKFISLPRAAAPRIWILALACCVFSPAAAQSVIKILHFDKTTGIIDCGENVGLHIGDVFDVNRYAGDFVYWIGRVEVVLVKPKMAGVKTLFMADNAVIQQGDVLELRKREFAPVLEKTTRPVKMLRRNSPQPGKLAAAENDVAAGAWRRSNPVLFGVGGGILQPFLSSSQSLGLRLSLPVVEASHRIVRVIDMSHAYATSLAWQAFCNLPLARRLALNLDYAYVPLNVKSGVEGDLLGIGRQASASLMKIGATVNYRFSQRLQLGLGAGLFLPQVTIKDTRQSEVTAERRWGGTLEGAYYFPLASAIWLKSVLGYSIFGDDGPAIQYLTLQTGLGFAIGNPEGL